LLWWAGCPNGWALPNWIVQQWWRPINVLGVFLKYILWTISLPLMVVAVVFAVANRGLAPVDLWPLDLTVEIPMYLIALLSLLVGFILGGIVSWISAGRTRGRARSALYRAEQLERENAHLKSAAPAKPAAAADGTKQLT
jgi:uncharacterized integral membrane protein